MVEEAHGGGREGNVAECTAECKAVRAAECKAVRAARVRSWRRQSITAYAGGCRRRARGRRQSLRCRPARA